MYWINGPECPVWHEVAGFSESMHGGLKPKMIENLRKVYINLKRLNEEINPEGTINNERGLQPVDKPYNLVSLSRLKDLFLNKEIEFSVSLEAIEKQFYYIIYIKVYPFFVTS